MTETNNVSYKLWPALLRRSRLRELGLTDYKIRQYIEAGEITPVKGQFMTRALYRKDEVFKALNIPNDLWK